MRDEIAMNESRPYDTWTFASDTPMELGVLHQGLNHPPETVFRAKGFVHAIEKPQRWLVFQLVGRRATGARMDSKSLIAFSGRFAWGARRFPLSQHSFL